MFKLNPKTDFLMTRLIVFKTTHGQCRDEPKEHD